MFWKGLFAPRRCDLIPNPNPNPSKYNGGNKIGSLRYSHRNERDGGNSHFVMFSLVFTPASHHVITTAPVALPNHNNVFIPASHSVQTGSDVAAIDRILVFDYVIFFYSASNIFFYITLNESQTFITKQTPTKATN